MLPAFSLLRKQLQTILENKHEQGHATAGLADELAALPESYDAFAAFARRVADLPLREDWPYVEPSDWETICRESDPSRPLASLAVLEPKVVAGRIETAFLSSVCGCTLGKPLEFNPTLEMLRPALEALGEWPLRDYITERLAITLKRPLHPSWRTTTREHLAFVTPDDDINYTVIGMLVLEKFGIHFTQRNLTGIWLWNLPISSTFGPERTTLLKMGLDSMNGSADDAALWADTWNPREEWCGALIRADAYGYACAGHPALAAELAWRDSSLTHRRTGIYGTMFAAAAIAAAPVCRDPLEIFRIALAYIPARSRFHQIVSDSIDEVSRASDWIDGYERIHRKYGQFTHCLVFQEVGTLINTLRFADDIGDGICKQVSQGNDTDSFGATAGSILGAFFGPDHLEPRWLEPLRDDLQTTLADFQERSLRAVARRMAALPARIQTDLVGGPAREDGPSSPAASPTPGAAAGI
jgi:ADP-ribosylglycohydrolase